MKSLKLIFAIGAIYFFTGNVFAQTTVKDACGNTYNSMKIGNQVWLEENVQQPCNQCPDLKQVTLGNSPSSNGDFLSLTEPMYTYYSGKNDQDPGTGKPLGVLFNHAAITSCNVCPNGFRIATKTDWETLLTVKNGKALKSRDASNGQKAFAYIAGRADAYGPGKKGTFVQFWSSNSVDDYKGEAFLINSNGSTHFNPEDKRTFMYVRCIKEEVSTEESTELRAKEFNMLAHSIQGGKDKGSWFLGVDRAEAANAAKTNSKVMVRIVKRIPGVGVKTIEGKDGHILDIDSMDEKDHYLGGHIYAFRAKNIGDGQYYLATGQKGDKNIYIRHISSGNEATAKEFAFRNIKAFATDNTSGEFSSFESVEHPGHYLRHSGFVVFLATKNVGNEVWRGDVSWKLTQ
ncbi:MAG: FISUMP domain-containing protein [Bacteroidota bacterium]